MNLFESLLSEFEDTLLKHNPVNFKKLQNPITEKQLEEYFIILDIQDEDFKSLFKWKNGINSSSGFMPRFQIFDFGGLVSIDYIMEMSIDNNDNWEKDFLPLVSSGDGDFILFNNKKGSNYGKLHLYSVAVLSIEEPLSYFDSIRTMIETTIKAYKKKILVYNYDEDWLNNDRDKFNTLAKKLNPNAEFWKLD